jgi:hypothetical protein
LLTLQFRRPSMSAGELDEMDEIDVMEEDVLAVPNHALDAATNSLDKLSNGFQCLGQDKT